MFTKSSYIIEINDSEIFLDEKPSCKHLGNGIWLIVAKNYEITTKLSKKPVVKKTKLNVDEWSETLNKNIEQKND